MLVFDAERDRGQIRKLFAKDFGPVTDRYDNVVVEGEFAPSDNITDAVLGYYATQPRLRLYGLQEFDYELTLESAKQRVLGYKIDDEVADEQRAILDAEIPGWRNPRVMSAYWAGRELYYKMYGLPVCFFSFMTDAEGAHSVVLWYPRHMIPGGTLVRVQQGVRSADLSG